MNLKTNTEETALGSGQSRSTPRLSANWEYFLPLGDIYTTLHHINIILLA